MEENNSKFSGLKKLFFTDEYLENNKEEKTEKNPVEPLPETKIQEKPIYKITNISSMDDEAKSILDKIYKYLDSINSPDIDFIEVWDAMEEMGGVNETNLKATFAAMKIASKGALTKELIINSGKEYLSKITVQLDNDISLKTKEISNLETKKKDESTFLVNKKKEIEDNILKLQGELNQTQNFIKDLDLKYEPKINEIQTKIMAGKSAVNRITDEFNQIISLVNKTLQ